MGNKIMVQNETFCNLYKIKVRVSVSEIEDTPDPDDPFFVGVAVPEPLYTVPEPQHSGGEHTSLVKTFRKKVSLKKCYI